MLCGVCGVCCVFGVCCVCEGAGVGTEFYLRTLFIAKVEQHKTFGTDEGKQKYWEWNLSQRHSVHHKSLMDWSGID